MRIKHAAGFIVLTASAVMLTASMASAAPILIYGSTVDDHSIFSYDPVSTTVTTIYTNPSYDIDSLLFDASGRIIFSVQNSGLLVRINANGSGETVLASSLQTPKDLALIGNNLYFAEANTGQIGVLNLTSLAVSQVPGGPGSFGPASSSQGGPHGLTSAGGTTLFVNAGNRNDPLGASRLEEIDPSTGLVVAGNQSALTTGLDGLTFGLGFLFATDELTGRLLRYNPLNLAAGALTLCSGLINPDGVAISAAGIGYLAAFGSDQLIQFDPNIANSCTPIKTINGIDDLAPLVGPGSPDIPSDVPEPATLMLLGTGLLAVVRFKRKR